MDRLTMERVIGDCKNKIDNIFAIKKKKPVVHLAFLDTGIYNFDANTMREFELGFTTGMSTVIINKDTNSYSIYILSAYGIYYGSSSGHSPLVWKKIEGVNI